MKKLMLKLYLNDKHVGYEYRRGDKLYHIPNLDYLVDIPRPWGNVATTQCRHIKHDSFGIGIEINGKWLFPWDEVVITGVRLGGKSGTLNYKESSVEWEVYIPDALYPLSDFRNMVTGEWSIEKKEK